MVERKTLITIPFHLFYFCCSFRGPVDLRCRQWNSADVIAPFLRRCLRRTNAGDSDHDSDPTPDSDAGRPHHGAALDGLPDRVGHLRADQLRWICDMGEKADNHRGGSD